MDLVSVLILIATTVALGIATLLIFRKQEASEESDDAGSKAGQNGTTKSKKQSNGTEAKQKSAKKKTQQQVTTKEKFTHPWLVTTLKGHTGEILGIDLSPNNKFIASCADDRSVYVWVIKDFSEKDHKSIRVNIPFDYATSVRWSPDSTAFIITRAETKMLEVFKLGRKPNKSIGNITSVLQWPEANNRDYVGLGIACNGKFIMNALSDGSVQLREPKGALLHTFLSGQSSPVLAKVSPCGRFVCIGGKDIEMFEVKLSPSGDVSEPQLKWRIPVKGGQLSSFAFNTDSSKLALVKTDGSWMMYDTTGSRVNAETTGNVPETSQNPQIALSGDFRVVAVAANHSLYLFSAFTGELVDQINDIFKGNPTCVEFSACGKYVITGGDKEMHVFENVSWYKETVKRLKSQIQDASITGSMRKRLASELTSYEDQLQSYN